MAAGQTADTEIAGLDRKPSGQIPGETKGAKSKRRRQRQLDQLGAVENFDLGKAHFFPRVRYGFSTRTS